MPVGAPVPVPIRYAGTWEAALRRAFLDPFVEATERALSAVRDWSALEGALPPFPDADDATTAAIAHGFAKLREYHRQRFARSMRPFFGRGLRTARDAQMSHVGHLRDRANFGVPVDIFSDPGIAPVMDQAIRDFVDLIRTIPPRHHATLKRDIRRLQMQAPFDRKRLNDLFEHSYQVSGYNLRRLTRDQTSKTIGKFSETRQTQLGIRQYVWQTSLDERVRPSHAQKEGVTFGWDTPPPDTGHPGEDIHCRCTAAPVIGQQRPQQIRIRTKSYTAELARGEAGRIRFTIPRQVVPRAARPAPPPPVAPVAPPPPAMSRLRAKNMIRREGEELNRRISARSRDYYAKWEARRDTPEGKAAYRKMVDDIANDTATTRATIHDKLFEGRGEAALDALIASPADASQRDSINQGLVFVRRLLGANAEALPPSVSGMKPTIRVVIDDVSTKGRGYDGYAKLYSRQVTASTTAPPSTYAHEFMHVIESNSKARLQAAVEWYEKHTAGEALKKDAGWAWGEGRKDKLTGWRANYAGSRPFEAKRLSYELAEQVPSRDGAVGGTEVATRAVDMLLDDPVGLVQDNPHLFDFVFDTYIEKR